MIYTNIYLFLCSVSCFLQAYYSLSRNTLSSLEDKQASKIRKQNQKWSYSTVLGIVFPECWLMLQATSCHSGHHVLEHNCCIIVDWSRQWITLLLHSILELSIQEQNLVRLLKLQKVLQELSSCYLFHIVKQLICELKQGLLLIIRCSWNDLVEVVVHDGGFQAQVLPHVVPSILPQ